MERVLIIEDDELIAELERDYLEANGYETDLAFDGITGEKKAKTEKYDAIQYQRLVERKRCSTLL